MCKNKSSKAFILVFTLPGPSAIQSRVKTHVPVVLAVQEGSLNHLVEATVLPPLLSLVVGCLKLLGHKNVLESSRVGTLKGSQAGLPVPSLSDDGLELSTGLCGGVRVHRELTGVEAVAERKHPEARGTGLNGGGRGRHLAPCLAFCYFSEGISG